MSREAPTDWSPGVSAHSERNPGASAEVNQTLELHSPTHLDREW